MRAQAPSPATTTPAHTTATGPTAHRRRPRGAGVPDRIQPHGDVRQTRGADQECGLETDQVEAPGDGVAEEWSPGVA